MVEVSIYTFREMEAVERIQNMAFQTNLFRGEIWRRRAVKSLRAAGVKVLDEKVALGRSPLVGCEWPVWLNQGFSEMTRVMEKQKGWIFKNWVDEGWSCAVWGMSVQSWLDPCCTAGVVIRGVWVPPDGNVNNFKTT